MNKRKLPKSKKVAENQFKMCQFTALDCSLASYTKHGYLFQTVLSNEKKK